jgi:hypothetical protein
VRSRLDAMSGRVLVNAASVKMERGDIHAAFALREEARQVAARTGDARAQRWLRMELVTEHFVRGDLAAAGALADDLVHEIEAGSRSDMESTCRVMRARLRLLSGDNRGALDDAAHALDLGRSQGPQELYSVLSAGALVHLECGNPAIALTLLDELLAAVSSSGQPHFGVEGWSAPAALTALELGRGTQLCAVLSATTVPSRWIDAATCCASGDISAAADIYSTIGSLPDEANARLASARQLLSRGERASATREVARAMMLGQQMGAKALVASAQALARVRAS